MDSICMQIRMRFSREKYGEINASKPNRKGERELRAFYGQFKKGGGLYGLIYDEGNKSFYFISGATQDMVKLSLGQRSHIPNNLQAKMKEAAISGIDQLPEF